MARQQDYYEVLGVSRNATEDEIRRAYLKLAHKYHPDKTGGDKAAEDKLKEINAAYDTLKNAEKRAKYDQFGHMGEQFGGDPGFGGGFESPFEDLFDTLFGGRRGARQRRAAPGNDLEYRLSITLREAAFGAHKTLSFDRMEVCGECHGNGAAPGTRPEPCSACGGSGQVRRVQGFFSVSQTCSRCRGTGQVVTRPCASCGGSGHVRSRRELSVDIPPGVDSGSRVRLSGEGEPGVGGGPRGDLYIHITVEPDEIFLRDGTHVICEVPLSFTQAALGAEIRVPTLKGEANLKIPGGTQSGQVFRLRGQGLPDVRGYRQGDELVKVQVETPTKLSREQKDLLKQFDELSNAKTYPLHRRFMDTLKRSFGSE